MGSVRILLPNLDRAENKFENKKGKGNGEGEKKLEARRGILLTDEREYLIPIGSKINTTKYVQERRRVVEKM